MMKNCVPPRNKIQYAITQTILKSLIIGFFIIKICIAKEFLADEN